CYVRSCSAPVVGGAPGGLMTVRWVLVLVCVFAACRRLLCAMLSPFATVFRSRVHRATARGGTLLTARYGAAAARAAAAGGRTRTRVRPRVGIILGSGLGGLADARERRPTAHYAIKPAPH